MAILIKGMEMPKSCFNCRCPRACQAINRRIDEMDRTEWFPQDHRHSDCPLIEVPEPHGRLIDADKLNYTMLYKENWMRGTGVEAPAVWRKDIDAAPTVIPASEKGEL